VDRDTVRIVLLVIGILVIAGIYVWGVHKQKILDFLMRRGEFDELEFDQSPDSEPAIYDETEEYASARVPKRREPHFPEDEFEDDDLNFRRPEPPPPPPPPEKPDLAKTAALGAPFLIQLSVVAGGNRVFRGEELRDAMLSLELVHGEMDIFHRLDRDFRDSLFSIASLVEPGTFPIDDMASFECPGIVLFFQPARVPNPVEVFDDLVATGHDLAVRLNGIEWDEARRPLTSEKIADMRARLKAAYA
jgi:cell division protein ZipA